MFVFALDEATVRKKMQGIICFHSFLPVFDNLIG